MKNKTWYSSKEAKQFYKIKSCDLMHLRINNNLEFKKEGNTFFYSKESIEKLNDPTSKN